VALLAALGGYFYYQSYQNDLSERAGRQLTVAQRLLQSDKEGDRKKGLADLRKLAEDAPGPYAVLVNMRLGGELEADGETADAIAAYKKVVDSPDAEQRFKSLATLRIVSLEATPENWTETKNRITPIAADGSPWKYSAREQLALAAIAADQKDEARTVLLQLIGDRNTPAPLKQRSENLLSLITVAAGPPAEAQKTEAGNKEGAAQPGEDTKKSDTAENGETGSEGAKAPSDTN
ncbi:MAG: tetratricopeptide repeat protein, partial [Pseudomonadota bacterium]